MKNLIIKAADVKQFGEIKDRVDSYSCAEIADGVASQDITVEFSLKPIEEDILLTGEIKGFFGVQCCRCLNGFRYPVDIKLTQVYPSSTEEINLEDEIRESLILNVPIKPLCGQDCKGLCPQCGKNLNAGHCECAVQENDPRLNILKKLIK